MKRYFIKAQSKAQPAETYYSSYWTKDFSFIRVFEWTTNFRNAHRYDYDFQVEEAKKEILEFPHWRSEFIDFDTVKIVEETISHSYKEI
jgi:hypothetical protein